MITQNLLFGYTLSQRHAHRHHSCHNHLKCFMNYRYTCARSIFLKDFNTAESIKRYRDVFELLALIKNLVPGVFFFRGVMLEFALDLPLWIHFLFTYVFVCWYGLLFFSFNLPSFIYLILFYVILCYLISFYYYIIFFCWFILFILFLFILWFYCFLFCFVYS